MRTAVHEYRQAQDVSETEEPLLPVPTHVETKAQFGQNDAGRFPSAGRHLGPVSLGQLAVWAAPAGPALSRLISA